MSKVIVPDALLLSVEKPARYIGSEFNAIVKANPEQIPVRVCFCFPDVYEVGMSHLGLQLLYDEINRFPNCYCERSFAPWTDMERKMREKGIPLYSLETFTPLKEMDFVAFTLQYEMCFTNLLNMIDLAGIPLYAKDRRDGDPLVIAGGPTACNPEVMAPFIDIFYIGEGEVRFQDLFDRYEACGKNREAFLAQIKDEGPFYVPKFYHPIYADHNVEGYAMPMLLGTDNPHRVKKDIQYDLDHTYYPTCPIIPNIQSVQDRAVVEILRGCPHGCRFCQAGQIYKPVRYRSKETVLAYCDALMKNTGYDEISFTSLSSDDYPWLGEILERFHEKYPHISISLPSLRVDSFSLDLMRKLSEGKKSSLTFAAEAGTQRLRDVINKGITEDEILNGCKLAFDGGWGRVKLYFMLGLPTETDADVLSISDLADKIVGVWKQADKTTRARDVSVTVSTSFFVPKAFTPFQWAPQAKPETLLQRQYLLNDAIHKGKIRYSCHDAYLSALEGLLARGDRRVAEVVRIAWEKGCRFDAWSDHFQPELWQQAIEESGIDVGFYLYREREKDEYLPWDVIDCGVSKAWMYHEYEKSKAGLTTASCAEKCSGCGMGRFGTCQFA